MFQIKIVEKAFFWTPQQTSDRENLASLFTLDQRETRNSDTLIRQFCPSYEAADWGPETPYTVNGTVVYIEYRAVLNHTILKKKHD